MALKCEYVLSILVSVLSGPVMSSMDRNMTLDEYCYTQLPHSLRKPQAMFSYIRYVRMCSNIEAYSECLLFTREAAKTGVTVQPFEKAFPSRYNIFKAGYLFCAEELLDRFDRYKFDNEDVLRCQHRIDHSSCSANVKLTAPEPSSTPQNSSDIDSPACSASMKYYNCLRKKYVECDSEFSYLLTYQLSRLGRACLQDHKEYNELLFGIRCLQSGATSSLRRTDCVIATSGNFSGVVLRVLVALLLLSLDNFKL